MRRRVAALKARTRPRTPKGLYSLKLFKLFMRNALDRHVFLEGHLYLMFPAELGLPVSVRISFSVLISLFISSNSFLK